jgi:hypothetical protein
MILGFFLQVGKLKRQSKNLVQPYPTKFISAIKFLKNDLFGDKMPEGNMLTFLGMCGIIYIENKERRKNKCQRNIGQVAPTAEQILSIVRLLMMTLMRI